LTFKFGWIPVADVIKGWFSFIVSIIHFFKINICIIKENWEHQNRRIKCLLYFYICFCHHLFRNIIKTNL